MKTFQKFMEMASRRSLTSKESKIANNLISAATKGFLEKIPLNDIFDALKQIGVHAVQEDGTPWSGFLTGGAECGSRDAEKQRANLDLVRTDDGTPLNNTLVLMWCKMQSGNYEVVSYVS
jgi:hypothetical protein